MEAIFRNKNIVETVNKWKFHLIVISIVAIAVGVFISSPIVITPKYKSSAVVYPVNIYTYSKESETEQMLQIFNSNDIKEQMLQSFDLAKHYKISKQDPQFYTYFLDEYGNNVSINKTEYESVEITVLDKDPKIACQMVDSIISFYDKKVASLHKKKHSEAYVISEKVFKQKIYELDSLEKLQENIRLQYGILNYNSQINEVTKGNFAGNNEAKQLFKNLQEKGIDFQRLDSLIWYARRDYLYFKNQTETELREIKKSISYSQVISEPIVADKKAYPIRWLVVAITFVTAIIFSIIVITIIESKNKK